MLTAVDETKSATFAIAMKAEAIVATAIRQCLSKSPRLAALGEGLQRSTGVSLRDATTCLALPPEDFTASGWRRIGVAWWRHASISAPDIVESSMPGLVVIAEDAVALAGSGSRRTAPFGRPIRLFEEGGVFVDVVEHALIPNAPVPTQRMERRIPLHKQFFRTRRRDFRESDSGLRHLRRLIDAAVLELGAACAAAIFLGAEREYWAARCEAGAALWRRQRAFGVGWSNVGPYWYCCLRSHLHFYYDSFVALGFDCVDCRMEEGTAIFQFQHSQARWRILLYTDRSKEEGPDQLLKRPLSPLTWYGRAGLWSALHGEGLLQGGPFCVGYHCDVVATRERLGGDAEFRTVDCTAECHGIASEPELRPVDPTRVNGLERNGYVSRADAENFRKNGAAGARLALVQTNSSQEFVCLPGADIAAPISPTPQRPRVRLCRRRPSGGFNSKKTLGTREA